ILDLDQLIHEIACPGNSPLHDLIIEDIIQVTGTEVTPGAPISCHYVGVAWSTVAEFNASFNRGQPLEFTVGIGQVITGWDQGLLGMKAGGRRRLEIPPHLAYGENGAGADIGPNETLIFVVDLVEVRS